MSENIFIDYVCVIIIVIGVERNSGGVGLEFIVMSF